jgi:hypothetical protein
MSDLDAPATKRDLLAASDRIERLAFGMLAIAVIAIIVTAVTLILRS